MQVELFSNSSENIYTVTDLTQRIKSILEENYASVWLTGEISNFHAHASGHYYFTLKDENAQISAVMFRGANRNIKFKLEDGLKIVANGRISVYEKRGNYQIILEYLEPKGLGALQLAFTQLKEQLLAEGLFDGQHKKSLPFSPKTIGIITSETGAVIRDMIHVLHRRDPRVNILLFPVPVQGEASAPSIAKAIETANQQSDLDLLIVGRGGGSLEDLWAFNTEVVARAIFASQITIISAVGHETDTTIADYVADYRAPTPSAAAEMAVPVFTDLVEQVSSNKKRLISQINKIFNNKSELLKFWTSHIKHPQRKLEELSVRLDDLTLRFHTQIKNILDFRRRSLRHLGEKLTLLSPLATLSRGYSITRHIEPDGQEGLILKDAEQTQKGNLLSIQVMNGKILAEVK